jgi:uncharacterized membrane protein
MAKKGTATRRSIQRHEDPPSPDTTSSSYEVIVDRLKGLEHRIAQLELHFGISNPAHEVNAGTETTPETGEESEDALETRVGENWFAKVGIVVLALGMIFLLTFPYQNLPSYAPSVIGYILVAAVLGLSRYWKDSFQQVSRYLLGGGLLLLYFTTLRLSHFGPAPTVTNVPAEIVLLLAVVALNLFVSISKRSPYLVGFNLTLGFLTALAAGEPLVVFSIVALMSVLSTVFSVRYQWHWIILLGVVASNLTHFLWSINNPLFGNSVQQVSSPGVNLFFILLYAAAFGVATFIQTDSEKEKASLVTTTIFNGFISYGLLTLLTVTVFKSSLAAWHLAASALYLALAVAFWMRARSKYVTFVYAMLGYVALSATIVDISVVPDLFVWLCWQSILVLSTAVWFRSRFIVVANFAIFLMVFVAYLLFAGTAGLISISFGIVALVSARILNWRKDKLELKTEMMRNAYLASALFVLPYALYHVVPHEYVSVSWLGLALFYYIASRLLNNNRKYRWMALLTTMLTVCYVFLVELVGLDPTVRIISFLLLGTSLLAVSMIYSRKRRRNSS